MRSIWADILLLGVYCHIAPSLCLPKKILYGRFLSNSAFRMFYGISVDRCGEECTRRLKCHYFTFHTKLSVCYLNEMPPEPNELVYDSAFLQGWREDWINSGQAAGLAPVGSNTEDEDTSYRSPVGPPFVPTQDCGPPAVLPNGRFYGNTRAPGSRVKYVCHPGYTAIGSRPTITCLENGTWTRRNLTCRTELRQNWQCIEDTCYLLVNNQTDWYTAKINCEMMAGHLVKIDSAEKRQVIKSLVDKPPWGPNYWLGARHREGASGYVWTDGSPVTYLPNTLSPSNSERCVDMGNIILLWWSWSCTATRYSICERENV